MVGTFSTALALVAALASLCPAPAAAKRRGDGGAIDRGDGAGVLDDGAGRRSPALLGEGDASETRLETAAERLLRVATSRKQQGMTSLQLRQLAEAARVVGWAEEGTALPMVALRALGAVARHGAADAGLLVDIAVVCRQALPHSSPGVAIVALQALAAAAGSAGASDRVFEVVVGASASRQVRDHLATVHGEEAEELRLEVLSAIAAVAAGAAAPTELVGDAVGAMAAILSSVASAEGRRRMRDVVMSALTAAARRQEAGPGLLHRILAVCEAVSASARNTSAWPEVPLQALQVASVVSKRRSADAGVLASVVNVSTGLASERTVRAVLRTLGDVAKSDAVTSGLLRAALEVVLRVRRLDEDPGGRGAFDVLEHAARSAVADAEVLGSILDLLEDSAGVASGSVASDIGALGVLIGVASSGAVGAPHIERGVRICEAIAITGRPVSVLVALKAFKALRIFARSGVASADCLSRVMGSAIGLLKTQQLASLAKLEALTVFQEIAANRASTFGLLTSALPEVERVANWCTPECVEQAQMALVAITLSFTSTRFAELGERRAAQVVRSLLSVASRSRGRLVFPRAAALCVEVLRTLAQTPRLMDDASLGLQAAGLSTDIVAAVGAFLVEPGAAALYARAPAVCGEVAAAGAAAPLASPQNRGGPTAGSLIAREILYAVCAELREVASEAASAFSRMARHSDEAWWAITGRDLARVGRCLQTRKMSDARGDAVAHQVSAVLDGASAIVRRVPDRERPDFVKGCRDICEAARALSNGALSAHVVDGGAFAVNYTEVCGTPAAAAAL